MKTKEVIRLMMENDPSGEMDVILAADTGEGYVMLDKVFTDPIRKQQVDGDEIESYSKTVALFLGDSNSEKSKPAVFEYVMDPETALAFDDPFSDDYFSEYLELQYGKLKAAFEADLGIATKIPDDYKFRVTMNTSQDRLILQGNGGMKEFMPKLVSFSEFDKALLKFIADPAAAPIVGVDKFGKEMKIKRI